MIDADQKKAARRAKAQHVLDRVLEHFGEAVPVQLAGQAVAAREERQLALMLAPLVDDANDPERAGRLAVGAGEPAAGILDP